MKAAGFTLVELVVTIGILSIVAAVAAPRFFQASTFESRGRYDNAAAIVRLAQKTAVAWRRPVYVCVTATTVSAGSASGCGGLNTLRYPVSNEPATVTMADGVTLNPFEITFDGLGRPSAGVTITFTSSIAGDPARQISIAAESGYVSAN